MNAGMDVELHQLSDADLQERALHGDVVALTALLGRTEQRARANADMRAHHAQRREQVMLERVVFQEDVIALRDSNELRFRQTVNNLVSQLRVSTAERNALRYDLLTIACEQMTRRLPMTCTMCHLHYVHSHKYSGY